MRILSFIPNLSDHIHAHGMYHFEEELARQAEVVNAGKGYPLHKPNEPVAETVNRLGPFDWVWGASCRGVKSAGRLIDLHQGPPRKVARINRLGFSLMFLTYLRVPWAAPDKFQNVVDPYDPDYYLRRLRMPVAWLPWSVEPRTFRDWGLRKVWDVVATGAHGLPAYPLRHEIYRKLPIFARKYKFKALVRGGIPPQRTPLSKVMDDPKLSRRHSVYTDFSRLLNQAKIYMFGCSVFRYPVKKLWEVMASRCLVMCNEPDGAEELGLIDGVNYVKISRDDWREKLLYYLENGRKRRRITRGGVKLVHQRHTNRVRVKEMLKILNAYPNIDSWDRRVKS